MIYIEDGVMTNISIELESLIRMSLPYYLVDSPFEDRVPQGGGELLCLVAAAEDYGRVASIMGCCYRVRMSNSPDVFHAFEVNGSLSLRM